MYDPNMSARDQDGPPPGTIEDLISDSVRLRPHKPATRRSILDWVEKGLLDHPVRRSAGKGHGSHLALFSSHQRQVFHMLIQRRDTVPRLSSLARVPLVFWVYWDEIVPTSQASRALVTSITPRKTAEIHARELAADYVQRIRHPDARETAMTTLSRLIGESITRGTVGDRVALNQAFMTVFDPNDEGRSLAPPGVPTISPAQLFDEVVLEEHAKNTLPVPMPQLELARMKLRDSFLRGHGLDPYSVGLATPLLVDLARTREFQALLDSIVEQIFRTVGHMQQPRPGK